MEALGFDVTLTTVAFSLLVILATYVAISDLWRELELSSTHPPYVRRDYVCHHDLVDPRIRADHLAFNAHLHEAFDGHRFVPVQGEDGCFIAFTHATCKEVMNDHVSFSSNPFPDDRLIALNTMAKADHSRVLRYVHSFYSAASIQNLESKLEEVVEGCTAELQGSNSADVVQWAKRIHMASTLSRLGVSWVTDWALVDEVIHLNNAMVALVAPLGGVGKKYSTLPWGYKLKVLLGVLQSIVPLLRLVQRLGLAAAWAIIRLDVTVLWPPAKPRIGLWWHPELLPLVPKYFLSLLDLLEDTQGEGPLVGMRAGVAKGDLSLAEALTLIVQLMVNMTSANALCSLVYRLAKEQEAFREVVAAQGDLSEAFVQEVLRLDAPLQRNPRRVTSELAQKWRTSGLEPGNQVLLFLGAANMDPSIYEDPAAFRIDRDGELPLTPPLTFGSGIHYCLGSHLVKIELRMALKCLLHRFKSIVVEDFQRLDDVDVGNWGFKKLTVRLEPEESL